MTRRPATLRFRLVTTTLALVLLPALLSGGAMLVYGVRQVRARVTERNEALARALAGEVREFLEAQRTLTEEVALVAALSRPRGPAAVREALTLHIRANPLLVNILLLEGGGRVVEAVPPDPDAVGLDLSSERYVRDALASGQPTWSAAESLWSGRPVVALVVPGGEWTAVSYLDTQALRKAVEPTRLQGGRTAAILERDGSFVAAGDRRLADEHVILNVPLVRGGAGGRVQSGAYRFQGREWLGSVWPVQGSGWVVMVSEPLEEATAGVDRLRLVLHLVMGAFAGIAAGVSVIVAGRVVRPVEALSHAIRRVEEGAYHGALQPVASGYREVDDLARAFEAMAAAVRSREEALARSERSYRTLVDSSLVGVARTMPEGTVVFCNDAMARFFGAHSPEEVVGSSAVEVYRDPERRTELLALVEKNGKVTNFEMQACGRDGVERSLLLNATREGDLLSVVAVDISELKHAATDCERLEHQLLHAQKLEAVGRLAGGIAHDFNNLLTAIMGFAGMLKEELAEDDPRREGVLGILQSANRAAHLTRSLLAYSRKQFMQPRPVDLCEVIRTVDKLLRRIIGEDVELVLDLPERGLPVVADPGQVEQVLVNLCTNARDAMPGGGRLRIAGDEIAIDAAGARSHQLSGPGRYVRVRVEDSGRGMSREVMARVFEPFYTTDTSGSGDGARALDCLRHRAPARGAGGAGERAGPRDRGDAAPPEARGDGVRGGGPSRAPAAPGEGDDPPRRGRAAGAQGHPQRAPGRRIRGRGGGRRRGGRGEVRGARRADRALPPRRGDAAQERAGGGRGDRGREARRAHPARQRVHGRRPRGQGARRGWARADCEAVHPGRAAAEGEGEAG